MKLKQLADADSFII